MSVTLEDETRAALQETSAAPEARAFARMDDRRVRVSEASISRMNTCSLSRDTQPKCCATINAKVLLERLDASIKRRPANRRREPTKRFTETMGELIMSL